VRPALRLWCCLLPVQCWLEPPIPLLLLLLQLPRCPPRAQAAPPSRRTIWLPPPTTSASDLTEGSQETRSATHQTADQL
jgi:hypothetical protein